MPHVGRIHTRPAHPLVNDGCGPHPSYGDGDDWEESDTTDIVHQESGGCANCDTRFQSWGGDTWSPSHDSCTHHGAQAGGAADEAPKMEQPVDPKCCQHHQLHSVCEGPKDDGPSVFAAQSPPRGLQLQVFANDVELKRRRQLMTKAPAKAPHAALKKTTAKAPTPVLKKPALKTPSVKKPTNMTR